MESYSIYFRFRNQEIKGYVQDYSDYAVVSFTNDNIINDFTGAFKFVNKKYIPGFIRNKEAKDIQDLTRQIEMQLK